MSHTDPLADMLTRIRNAIAANHAEVRMPASKLKKSVLDLLQREGFIRSYREDAGDVAGGLLVVELKYSDGRSVIRGIERVSKTGRRVYRGCDALPKVLSGFGLVVVSTSRGLMSDKDARKNRLGGEILAAVW